MRNCSISTRIKLILFAYLCAVVIFTSRNLFGQSASTIQNRCFNKAVGKVLFFIAVEQQAYKDRYQVAKTTMECYTKLVGYDLEIVFLDSPNVFQKCPQSLVCEIVYKQAATNSSKVAYGNRIQIFFRKHCIAAHYLASTDWLVVLDADTGIVNPSRCVEEFIDPNVDLIFYERFFNWEIASGNYIAKNSEFARKFLLDWAAYDAVVTPQFFSGYDNGALQMHLLKTLQPKWTDMIELCNDLWRNATSNDQYLIFSSCVRFAMGARKRWPGRVKFLRRALGFVRDYQVTNDGWSDVDFMIHSWKRNEIRTKEWQSPFLRLPDVNKCVMNASPESAGWLWNATFHLTIEEMKPLIRTGEEHYASYFAIEANRNPLITYRDVRDCWPNCRDDS